MRIIVCPSTVRGDNDGNSNPMARESRKLAYWAWIAADLGHDVAVHVTGKPELQEKLLVHFARENMIGDMPLIRGSARNETCDVYLCTEQRLAASRPNIPKATKIIVSREGFPRPSDTEWCGLADVIMGPVLSEEDFTRWNERNRPPNPPEYVRAINHKGLATPWPIHEDIMVLLWRDGLTQAYLRDDLEPIRAAYYAKKERKFGFLGMPWGWRNEIESELQGPQWTFEWVGSGDEGQIVGADYLHWIAGCEAIMDLPGDTWNSYRFGEAAMMGVPLVEESGRINLTPTLTAENCVLVYAWHRKDQMLSALDRIDTIKADADAAYREGWSLRGQLVQAFKRIGIT